LVDKDFLVADEYAVKVCNIGKGAETCRYLIVGAGGFECGKDSEFKEAIDKKFEGGVRVMVAIGDNCAGITNVTGAA